MHWDVIEFMLYVGIMFTLGAVGIYLERRRMRIDQEDYERWAAQYERQMDEIERRTPNEQ